MMSDVFRGVEVVSKRSAENLRSDLHITADLACQPDLLTRHTARLNGYTDQLNCYVKNLVSDSIDIIPGYSTGAEVQ